MEKGMIKDQRFRIKFNGWHISTIWADRYKVVGNDVIMFYRGNEYIASYGCFDNVEKDTMAGDTIVHIVTV